MDSALSAKQPEERQADDQALRTLQFDYAWKWFNMHATQRTTMFNYFMVITEIMAGAYATMFKDGMRGISLGIALIGLVASIAFFCLDCSNRQLVQMGEDVLGALERQYLFAEPIPNQKLSQLGFIYRMKLRETAKMRNLGNWRAPATTQLLLRKNETKYSGVSTASGVNQQSKGLYSDISFGFGVLRL